jgi:hypothetical protein
MQSLPAPAWGLSRAAARRRRRLASVVAALGLLAAVIVVAVLVAVAPSDDAARGGAAAARPASAPGAAPSPDVALINGHALQRADCSDWNAGSASARTAVVGALRTNVGGATGYGPAVTLADDQAFALFGRACAGTIGRGWLLYSLYTRAAGFQSQRR